MRIGTEMGTLRIIYPRNSSGPLVIGGVTRQDFESLRRVIDAYKRLVDIHGQLKTHPNAQVRHDAREMLGIPHPPPEPMPREPFPLTSHTIKRRRRRNVVTDRQTHTLQPWLYEKAELTDVVEVEEPTW